MYVWIHLQGVTEPQSYLYAQSHPPSRKTPARTRKTQRKFWIIQSSPIQLEIHAFFSSLPPGCGCFSSPSYSKPIALTPVPPITGGADTGIGAALDGEETAVFQIGVELVDGGAEFVILARFGDLQVLCGFEILAPAIARVRTFFTASTGPMHAIRLDLGRFLLPVPQRGLGFAFVVAELEPLVEEGLGLETHAEAVAVAGALVGAEKGGVGEDDLPDVFEDAA